MQFCPGGLLEGFRSTLTFGVGGNFGNFTVQSERARRVHQKSCISLNFFARKRRKIYNVSKEK